MMAKQVEDSRHILFGLTRCRMRRRRELMVERLLQQPWPYWWGDRTRTGANPTLY